MGPAKIGTPRLSAGMTHGIAPMWSSWPWVMITASIRSFHSARKVVSGSKRCMP